MWRNSNAQPGMEARWAGELLPPAGRLLRAVAAPPSPGEVDGAGDGHAGDGSAHIDAHEDPKPLRGVHFCAESGPGPSGRRPEHLRDLLACPRRRVTRRLLALLDRLERMAGAGTLPVAMDWILRTRLLFIGKKNSTKPRPLRVGKFFRRMVAKHSLAELQPRILQRMLQARQCGVCLPGGTDVLIHWRDTVIKEIQSDVNHGVWAIIDLDWQNCYPSIEWDAIEDSVDRHLPELSRWTRWCHGARSAGEADGIAHGAAPPRQRATQPVILPSGTRHHADRGAEQGDPHGSLQCGLVLSDVSEAAEAAMMSACPNDPFMDVWCADDSQVVCRPAAVEHMLLAMDRAAAPKGIARGLGSDCKTHVRLIGHDDAISAFHGADAEQWITDYVRETRIVDAANSDFCLPWYRGWICSRTVRTIPRLRRQDQ